MSRTGSVPVRIQTLSGRSRSGSHPELEKEGWASSNLEDDVGGVLTSPSLLPDAGRRHRGMYCTGGALARSRPACPAPSMPPANAALQPAAAAAAAGSTALQHCSPGEAGSSSVLESGATTRGLVAWSQLPGFSASLSPFGALGRITPRRPDPGTVGLGSRVNLSWRGLGHLFHQPHSELGQPIATSLPATSLSAPSRIQSFPEPT